MAKYSDEFKINLVKEYLEGYYGYRLLAKKHNTPNTYVIRRWVRAFQAFGVDGIKRKRKNAVYSVPFKLDVLHYMERTGSSLQDTAIVFGLNNPPLIASWKNRYREAGVEGLENPKGRPSMTKKRKQPLKKEESREKQLETEIEELRLEVAYLKKLNAFWENPDTFLEKHKQRLHSSSKKKDSY